MPDHQQLQPKRFRLNPLARKRWNRFRRHKRGFWSFCLLVALYIMSLFSEFICNDRPLYVRFEGKSYFPVVKFYPDDTFTGSGRLTRPDYKTIRDSDMFSQGAGNRMIFAPVPYGPYEIIKPDTLRDEERVDITMRASPRVGNANINSDYMVVRSLAAQHFLPQDKGRPITEYWNLPAGFRAGIQARFRNEAASAQRIVLTNESESANVAEISMTAYSPRRDAPRDVRITFREVSAAEPRAHKFTFDAYLELVEPVNSLWSELEETHREALTDLARRAFQGLTVAMPLDVGDVEYTIQLRKNDIQWPFRPVRGHWLGIDNAGRDVLARILYGLRTSMTFGLLLVAFSMGFGILMGALQGYYGGRVDLVAQRIIEIWSTIPFLYVMILLGSMYGRSFSLLLFCYGIFNWIGISYYVRAEFLRLRNMPFVDAARCLGLSSSSIMFKHILPNALTPIITFLPFSLVGAIGSLAVLDYLGFGLPPPTPSWGELLQQAQSFRWAWWLILYPSLSLFVVILLGVFMGEGVRDAYDPKPVTRME
ncbi:MAG TPA: ABC transporter permease subunit [Kiritimatiellia bacterium]|nr:ABC transporter permease subunit [Kiritimatiellia bacterium]